MHVASSKTGRASSLNIFISIPHAEIVEVIRVNNMNNYRPLFLAIMAVLTNEGDRTWAMLRTVYHRAYQCFLTRVIWLYIYPRNITLVVLSQSQCPVMST